MGSVRRFEDLLAWQKARLLAREVYSVCGPGRSIRDFALADQIRKAAVSVPSNIAEGFERHGPREFARFLTIAKSSCGELRTQLYLAKDIGQIGEQDFAKLMGLAVEVGNLVGALRSYLARTSLAPK